ncbi:hypothetical protein MMC22_005827 [Lobaria immixta]|nr:hypothetical protein [Lobaria immixta]
MALPSAASPEPPLTEKSESLPSTNPALDLDIASTTNANADEQQLLKRDETPTVNKRAAEEARLGGKGVVD